jgi:hypothetical protein
LRVATGPAYDRRQEEPAMNCLPLLSLAAVALAGAGCAPAPLTKADVDGRIVCNVDRMDQVERAARREFKEVRWVACPQAVLRVN